MHTQNARSSAISLGSTWSAVNLSRGSYLCYTRGWARMNDSVTHMTGSCDSCKSVGSHIYTSHGIIMSESCQWVMGMSTGLLRHIWQVWVVSYECGVSRYFAELCHTCEWVMLQVRRLSCWGIRNKCGWSCIHEACRIYEWVMSHKLMSHVEGISIGLMTASITAYCMWSVI